MFPTIQVGPMALQAPGLILLIGLWLGLLLAERLAPRFWTNPQQIYNLVFVALIAGVIGARISYVIQNYEIFLQSPLNIFSLNPGLLDPISGVAIGIFSLVIYGNQKKIDWWPTLDAITPFLGVMVVAYGLANFASGDAFGTETTLPWGINLWGMKRHPAQVYQIIMGIIILVTIWPRRGNSITVQRIPGTTFVLFLALSAGAWLVIEAFRGDSVVLPNGVRVAQIGAWLVLAGSLLGLSKLHQQKPNDLANHM